MKKIVIVLVTLCLCTNLAWATGNEPVSTMPAGGASFLANLQAFLRGELAAIWTRHDGGASFVRSGGLHSTVGSCTASAISLEAFTSSGNRVTANGSGGSVAIQYDAVGIGANCANPGSDVCWVVASALGQDFSQAGGRTVVTLPTLPASAFNRVGTSNLYADCSSTTRPALPSDSVMLMKVTITNGAITGVTDLSNKVQNGTKILNVTAAPYNAPSDGTGNAATGINQALTDAAASGASVFAPCGTYRTTAQILLQSGVEFFGGGKDCTVIAPDTSTSIPRPILASSVSHWSVHDLQVDCGSEAVTGRQGFAALNTASYGVFERIKAYRCGQYGVLLHGDTGSAPYSSGGQGMILRDSVIDMGTVPTGACTGIIAVEYLPKGPVSFLAQPGPLITGNIILADAADAGVKINNSRGAHITGNTLSGATCSSATGAIIDAPGSANTLISHNTIYNTRLGITFGGAPRSNATGGNELRTVGAAILGNTIDSYTLAGMFSSDGATDVTIARNYLVVNGATSTGYGFDFQPQPVASSGFSYTRLKLDGNTLIGNQTGMLLQASSDAAYGYVDLSVVNNTLSSSLSTGRAIDITLAPLAVVTHNTIRGHRNAVLLGTGSNLIDLSHNTATDLNSANTAAQPCYAIVGDDPRIVGNTCVNSSGSYHVHYGLSLNATQRPVMSGNIFNAMETGDIVLVNAGSMTDATPAPQAFYVDQAATAAPADTTEDTVATITLPANYFTRFGGVSITAYGDTAGAGSTKDLRLYFGGALLTAALNVASGTNAYRFEADIAMPEINTTSQHAWVKGYDAGTLELSAYQSLAVNTTTGTVEVKVTCQKGTSGDTCRSRVLTVRPWR